MYFDINSSIVKSSVIFKALLDVMYLLSSGAQRIIESDNFRKSFSDNLSEFADRHQHDVQEFFISLLYAIRRQKNLATERFYRLFLMESRKIMICCGCEMPNNNIEESTCLILQFDEKQVFKS